MAFVFLIGCAVVFLVCALAPVVLVPFGVAWEGREPADTARPVEGVTEPSPIDPAGAEVVRQVLSGLERQLQNDRNAVTAFMRERSVSRLRGRLFATDRSLVAGERR